MSFSFAIVGQNDSPLYVVELTKTGLPAILVGEDGKETGHLNQFILHAALDVLEDEVWKTSQPYLKTVDRFNELSVSAYVTPSHVKLLLLHDSRGEDAIRAFFHAVHELYAVLCQNPFYDFASITSPAFDAKVRQLGRRLF